VTDKDLFGKADGLMRRHAAPGTETGPVPILTDFVDPPAPPEPPEAPAQLREEEEQIAARVMVRVEERLEGEMQRVRRELAQAVADAVREALADRPVK
jgi:hypothetical protein